MSKYIIEIAKEYEEYFKGVLLCGIADGKFAVDIIAREDLEELNSDYINENYGSMQYEAYRRGLEDAWEAARKIIRMPDGDILDLFPDCYASVCTAVQAILKYDASEAIAKLKAYEGNKDEPIKAGDLVERYIDGKLDSKGIYLQDAAYQKGFEDGKNSIDNGCNGCKYEDQHGYDEPCNKCLHAHANHYTPMPKDEICFGNEIVVNGERGVIVSHENEGCATIWALLNGYRTPQIVHKNNYTKTGRRFGIEEIMEAMRK